MQAQIAVDTFEERVPLTRIFWRGQWCWIAREVGRRLGYSDDARQFVDDVTRRWSDELVRGTDFEVIAGAELHEAKRLISDPLTSHVGVVSADVIAPRAPSAVVLFESGLNLALMKTEKPLGKHLRRWLATEVLPQLRRTGTFSLPERPAPEVPVKAHSRSAPGAGKAAVPTPARTPEPLAAGEFLRRPAAETEAHQGRTPMTLSLPAYQVKVLRALAAKMDLTPEQVAEHALAGWARTAFSLGVTGL